MATDSQQFSNNDSLVTAISIASGDTTNLAISGANFPLVEESVTGEYFFATFTNVAGSLIEIVKVTRTTGINSNWDITRAQEGTSALTWPIGSIIELRLTAGGLEKLQTDIDGVFDRILTDGTDVLVDGNGNVLSS